MIQEIDATARAERAMKSVRAGDQLATENALIREFELCRDAAIEMDARLVEAIGKELPEYVQAAKYIAQRVRERLSGDRAPGMGG